MNLDWRSSSIGKVRFFHLAISFVVTYGVHYSLGDAVDVLGGLAHVNVKGALEN